MCLQDFIQLYMYLPPEDRDDLFVDFYLLLLDGDDLPEGELEAFVTDRLADQVERP